MDDDELTDAEAAELFERTQHIGRAINALAQAEVAVAAVDHTPLRLDDGLNVNVHRVVKPDPSWDDAPILRVWTDLPLP